MCVFPITKNTKNIGVFILFRKNADETLELYFQRYLFKHFNSIIEYLEYPEKLQLNKSIFQRLKFNLTEHGAVVKSRSKEYYQY